MTSPCPADLIKRLLFSLRIMIALFLAGLFPTRGDRMCTPCTLLILRDCIWAIHFITHHLPCIDPFGTGSGDMIAICLAASILISICGPVAANGQRYVASIQNSSTVRLTPLCDILREYQTISINRHGPSFLIVTERTSVPQSGKHWQASAIVRCYREKGQNDETNKSCRDGPASAPHAWGRANEPTCCYRAGQEL